MPEAALHVLSNFSFLTGASHAEELVLRARELGLSALAITDDCSLSGVVRAHVEAKTAGLKLLIGARFDVQRNPGRALAFKRAPDEIGSGQFDLGLDLVAAPPDEGPLFQLILLAPDRAAYGNLSQFITDLRCAAPKGTYSLHWRGVQPQHLDGLLAIALPSRRARDAELLGLARWLLAHFSGRAWLGVDLREQIDDARWIERLQWLADQSALPLVAAPQVLMHRADRKPLQDLMTAIRLRKPLQECGRELELNASSHLQRLGEPYEPEWIEESARIADRCTFSLDELRYEYPDEIVPAGLHAIDHLRQLSYQGATRRWPAGMPAKIQLQIEHELRLIEELKYEPYFLTVADIVAFARARGILCQGRGSAANSAVCYCLGVTEVNPAESALLFERFISRERSEPPDIDIDFEHQRREEVMQYLYGKYGRRRAGLTAVVISYRPRSAIRDAGKALGLDEALVEKIAKDHHWWDGNALHPERLGDEVEDARLPWLFRLVPQLLGMPRHLSQHVGGFVLTQGLLSRLVPIENAAMVNRTVIQWDKNDLDALGLLKVDVLALGMLSCLRRALDLLSVRRGERFELQQIPRECRDTYSMLCRADAVGVFQVESRAQLAMLPRLQPRTFYDLVIEVAIVRPGPIQGGMVHPFLRRRQKLDPVDIPGGDALKPALARTLGVPIFQEQVMQVAVIAAGFTPGEADQLRRGMAAWTRKGDLSPFRDRLFQGMAERGYPAEFAERIYAQIQGFAEYGFPESHAASFALLTYASSWIKCHEPSVFLTALLNSQPLGFYAPSQLVQDAQRHGIEIRPPCVNASFWESTLEDDPGLGGQPAVRLGLHLVKGFKQAAAQRLVTAREGVSSARAALPPEGEPQDPWALGPYAPVHADFQLFDSAPELARRARLDRADLQALAAADALASLSGARRQQLWDAAALARLPPLLEDTTIDEPDPDEGALGVAPEGEELGWDYAALGLSLRSHPLRLLRSELAARGYAKDSAELLAKTPNRRLARAVGLVTTRQQPGTAKGTTFVTLEDESGCVQAIVWKDVRLRHREALVHARLLGVWGVWQREGTGEHAVCNLIAQKLEDLTPLLGTLRTKSRDFR